MHPTIGFLGFGNMARAIADGIIQSGFLPASQIAAYDILPEQVTNYPEKILYSKTALQLAEHADVIILAVKPQFFVTAIPALAKGLTKEHWLISIAAGMEIEEIKQLTGVPCPVVRVMPNTPAMIGHGVTAIARPEDVSDEQYAFAKGIFQCIGSVYEIPEDKFNEVTPVNGSSPAFFFLFAKILAEVAAKHGLSFDDALHMVADTMIGSAKMIKESGHTVDRLIEMVSSKGGTTVHALQAMQEHGFSASVEAGFARCVARAYELGRKES